MEDFDKLFMQREEDNKAKTSTRGTEHRQAINRKGHATYCEIQDSHGNATITTEASLAPNEEHNFYYSPEEEVNIGEEYFVRIFITDLIQQRGTVFDGRKTATFKQKWMDTKIKGIMKIMMVQDVGVPIAVIRVYQQDPLGNLTSNILFEYELPTNFHFCADLAATFSTVQIMKQQSIGFLFSSEKDKKMFNWHLENLQKILDLSKEKIKEVRT